MPNERRKGQCHQTGDATAQLDDGGGRREQGMHPERIGLVGGDPVREEGGDFPEDYTGRLVT